MEINNYQDKIDSVVQAGSKIIKDEEVESEAVPSIKSDIRSLESTWELLREKCTAVQLRYAFIFSEFTLAIFRSVENWPKDEPTRI